MDTCKCHPGSSLVSSLLGRRIKVTLLANLTVFGGFQRGFLKGPFCRKSPFPRGRNGRFKPGKLLSLIGRIGDIRRQFVISLL